MRSIFNDVNVLLEREPASQILSGLTDERDVSRLLCQENFHLHYLPLVGKSEESCLYDLVVRIMEMEWQSDFPCCDRSAMTEYCRFLLSDKQQHKMIVSELVQILNADADEYDTDSKCASGELASSCLFQAIEKRSWETGKNKVSGSYLYLSETCISAAADLGEVPFLRFASKFSPGNPMKLPLYLSFEELSDAALLPMLVDLEEHCRWQTVTAKSGAKPLRRDFCVRGECEFPDQEDSSRYFEQQQQQHSSTATSSSSSLDGRMVVRAARSVYGNGACNVAHLSGAKLYSRFRKTFHPDEDDGQQLLHLPCVHARKLIVDVMLVRDNACRYFVDSEAFAAPLLLPWCSIKRCMDCYPHECADSHDDDDDLDSCLSSVTFRTTSTMANPMRYIANESPRLVMRKAMARCVCLCVSRDVAVMDAVAKFISISTYEDVEKLVCRGVKACCMNENFLELAFAIARRISAGHPEWAILLDAFMAGKSVAFNFGGDTATLIKLIRAIGSSFARRQISDVSRFTKFELIAMVRSSFPQLSKPLTRRALHVWNSGTIALILDKLDSDEIKAYVGSCNSDLHLPYFDKKTVAVTATYLATRDSSLVTIIFQILRKQSVMFAMHSKSWDGHASSPDSWQEMVRPEYALMIEELKEDWPALRYVDGTGKENDVVSELQEEETTSQ